MLSLKLQISCFGEILTCERELLTGFKGIFKNNFLLLQVSGTTSEFILLCLLSESNVSLSQSFVLGEKFGHQALTVVFLAKRDFALVTQLILKDSDLLFKFEAA